jgi:hypothetical protein
LYLVCIHEDWSKRHDATAMRQWDIGEEVGWSGQKSTAGV